MKRSGFLPFIYVPVNDWPITNIKDIFHLTIYFLWRQSLARSRIRIEVKSLLRIRIRIEVKSWVRIRIRTETSTDPRHCSPHYLPVILYRSLVVFLSASSCLTWSVLQPRNQPRIPPWWRSPPAQPRPLDMLHYAALPFTNKLKLLRNFCAALFF